MESREEWVERAKTKLDDWNAELSELEARARTAKAESRAHYERLVGNLRTYRDEAREKLAEVQRGGDTAWTEASRGLQRSWTALSEGFRAAIDEFRSGSVSVDSPVIDRADNPEEEVDGRLRAPPSERFAGNTHAFSLGSALERLRAEDYPARDGHRQITLFHRSPVTQVLFDFEEGGYLEKHAAPGLLTLHVLEGELHVSADGHDHDLPAGEMLVLDPNVPHDVRASVPSSMLLTVHLEKKE